MQRRTLMWKLLPVKVLRAGPQGHVRCLRLLWAPSATLLFPWIVF